jgi:AmmeMemoRadiSam system protein B
MGYIRKACVSGLFYPNDPKQLTEYLSTVILRQSEMQSAIGVILPHAGYRYSGCTAGLTISQVRITDTVILLGPNHTGLGSDFSIMTKGAWATPLGNVHIDQALAIDLMNSCPLLKDDPLAHRDEHSLEVELPFLIYSNPNVKIIPITIKACNYDECATVAHSLATYLRGKDILIIVSSDMTHYESQEAALKKDMHVIHAIEMLNADALVDAVESFDISMCGFIPAYVAIVAAKLLGAKRAELIDYRTSGDVSKDFSSVVGYAGMVIR